MNQEKKKEIFEHPNIEKLSFIELGEMICARTYAESIEIIKGTKDFKFTNIFKRLSGSKSKIFSRIFYELFAYYQFIVLSYVLNILGLREKTLNQFGSELNRTIGLIAKSEKKLCSHIKNAISDYQFHNLVGSYLADDMSICNLNKEDFASLLKITGFDKCTDDYIMTSYVVSHSRLLRTLGMTKGENLGHDFRMLALWLIHTSHISSFRDSINEYFKRTYPGKVR